MRYIVGHRPDSSPKRPFIVWDSVGGWVCSSHKSQALATARAAELNA